MKIRSSNLAWNISSSGMYVQVLHCVEFALPYNFMELWSVEIHHIKKIRSHHTKKVEFGPSNFRKKGNISRTENQKCPKPCILRILEMSRIFIYSYISVKQAQKNYTLFGSHPQQKLWLPVVTGTTKGLNCGWLRSFDYRILKYTPAKFLLGSWTLLSTSGRLNPIWNFGMSCRLKLNPFNS